MDNNNPKPEIEKILRTCLENLRELAHTPSKPLSPDQKLCMPSEPLVKTTIAVRLVLLQNGHENPRRNPCLTMAAMHCTKSSKVSCRDAFMASLLAPVMEA